MLFYMKVHDSAICETWQLPLLAQQMALIRTQCREQVDKDRALITLSLCSYTQLQETTETHGRVTLEQEDPAHLRKIALVEQLTVYILLSRITSHLLFTGTGTPRKDIQNLMCSSYFHFH